MIANTCGVIIPASRPMLSTIISTRPLVFIIAPMVRASRHEDPVARAANVHPTIFPIAAHPNTRKKEPHERGSEREPMSVLSPE